MYLDLSKALHDAAARGTADRAPLAAGPVLQRIHRRRVARTATTSVVGVAAAGAVAITGAQLAGGRDAPAPAPAGPSTSPSPSPSTAPAPRSLPAPAGCGTRLDDLPPLDLDLSVTAGLAAVGLLDDDGDPVPFEGDPVFVEGEEIALVVGVTLGPGLAEDLASGRGVAHQTDVVAVADGVVVGVPDPATVREAGETEAVVGGTTVSGLWHVQLDQCGPDGPDHGEALVPGRYELYAIVSGVETNGGEALGAALTEPQPIEVVGVGTSVPDSGEEVVTDAPAGGAGDLTLTLDGLAGLPLGTDVTATDPASALVRWDPERCEGTDLPGQWVATAPDEPTASGWLWAPFTPVVFEDRVVRIDVLGTSVRTDAGVGVGSTLAEVQAAHPVERLDAEIFGIEAWGVVDGERTLAFEVAVDEADGLDGEPPVAPGAVVAMAVMQGVPYGYPAWGGEICG